MPVLGEGGHEQCCTIMLLHMNRVNKADAGSFFSLMCFCFQRIFVQNLFYELRFCYLSALTILS